jgi:predicted 2-oxoglutarate/Fe(II)-dependent dioxygenase YbiX
MKLIKHAEGVYEIEGFLPEELRIALLSESDTNLGWNTLHIGNTVKTIGNELYVNLKMQDIYKNIEKFFTNIESMIYSRDLRRLKKSEFMWPHTDDGNLDKSKKIIFGIAIYLNDNFEGGELIYPNLGLSITPKPGSMVIHDASFKHQVFPVLNGNRYSIITFVFGNELTKFVTTSVI